MRRIMIWSLAVVILLAGIVILLRNCILSNSRGDTIVTLELKSILTALAAYEAEYGKYPVVVSTTELQPSAKLFEILFGEIAVPLNPQKKMFLDVGDFRRSPAGLLDPFGKPYRIAIDVNHDGYCNIGTKKIQSPIVVWSDGPNRQNNDCGKDDICIVQN